MPEQTTGKISFLRSRHFYNKIGNAIGITLTVLMGLFTFIAILALFMALDHYKSPW